jgi:hypothetical protein
MAALLYEEEVLTSPSPSPSQGAVSSAAATVAGQYTTTGAMIKGQMPELMKGAGFIPKGGNAPLSDEADIARRAHTATMDLREHTMRGFHKKSDVVKGMSPDFLNRYGNLRTALSAPSIGEQLQQIVSAIANPELTRSFTAGNLGIGSVYGLTPFDLLAP